MKKMNVQHFLRLAITVASSFCSYSVVATTYDDDMFPNIFNANSQQRCLDCHSSSLVGATDRQSATDGYDYDTYANATSTVGGVFLPTAINQRANLDGNMPPTGTSLTGSERALIADWLNDGAPKSAATATTGSVLSASITKDAATLRGTVDTNTNGSQGRHYFEYGLTSSYAIARNSDGTQVDDTTRNTVTASATNGITHAISGLNCGTPYHYRIVAENGHNTAGGGDQTFTTDACDATVISYTAGAPAAFDEDSADQTFSVQAASDVTRSSSAITWSLVGADGGATKGTVTFDTSTSATPVTIRYNPDADASGSDSVTLRVSNVSPAASVDFVIPITINEIADTPSVTNASTDEDVQTTSGLVITRNAADSNAVTHFKITNIVGGTLFQNDGVTAISDGDFILRADANAGLKFTGAQDRTSTVEGDGSFDVQGATDNIGGGLSAVAATATITLNAVDDAPVIDVGISDVTVLEDADNTEIRLGRTFTDVDDNDGLITMSVQSNSNGALVTPSILGDRLTLDYQPDQFGTATIVVRGTSKGKTVDDTFDVMVTSQIDAPRITEGATLRLPATSTNVNTTFDLNVTDVEAGTLTWSFPAQGTKGTFSINASSLATSSPVTILYTPNTNAFGLDETGVIQVTNSTTGLTDTIAISIAVEGAMGMAPTIFEGATVTPPNLNEDTPTNFDLTSNQFGAVKWDVATQGSKGVFSIDSPSGSPVTITYTPAPDESGTDTSGVIRATNSMNGLSSTIAVTMNIVAVNDAPDIAQASPFDVPQTNEETPIIFVLSGSDVEDPTFSNLTWSVSTQGGKGNFSFDTSPTASPVTLRYLPAMNQSGTDTAGMITLTNGTTGLSETIQINMTIIGQDDPPVISEGDGPLTLPNTDEDVDATFTLNVTDVEAGTHLWRISSQGVNGVFSFDTTDTADSIDIRYTPTPDFNGDDTAVFVVTNNSTGQIDFIRVNITVDPVNDAPMITSAAPTTDLVFTEETAANIYQLTQTDIDDTSFTYSLGGTGLPGDEGVGDMAISASGLITWTPPRSGIFNGATAMVTVTVSDVDSSTAGSNVQSVTQMFNVSTIPVDTDGDGVADYSDNCPTIANAGQEDLDNDTVHLPVDGSGIPADGDVDPTATDAVNALGESYLNGGDACDEDIDGDGLSNDFENQAENTFLDPLNPADALADQDGDEISNLAEFLAGTDVNLDSVAPVVTPPGTVTVNATGSRTIVDIGQATASDNADPAIDIVRAVETTTALTNSDCGSLRNLPAKPDKFRVGRTTLTWAVCDVVGNIGTATQDINVVPLVSVSSGSVSGEGQAVSVDVMLNGPAASYPVTVAYQVSGTAVAGSDHDLATSGTVTFTDPSTVESINFNVLNDAKTESDETVVVTLSSATNAVLGSHVVHTLSITDENVAPQVNLVNSQGGQTRGAVVYQTDGIVTVMANASDANGDTLTFNWNASDAALLAVATINGDNITFNPAKLTVNTLHSVEVTVSDGTTSTTVNRLISVKDDVVTVTLKATDDTDGDGVADSDPMEGLADDDGDGIPNFKDNNATPPNVIESQTGNLDTAQVVETEPGLSISLGTTAIASDATGVHVSAQDVIDHGGAAGGLATNAETDYTFTDALFSFEVAGLTPAMASVNVVLPLPASIKNDVVYRKFIEATGWADFVEDDLNRLRSAPGSNGACPEPGSGDYTAGLTVGHNCLQLTIQDGGANDADGLRNFIVKDPGGLAIEPIDQDAIDAAEAAAEAAANSSGRAGAMNLFIIGLWLMLVGALRLRQWRVK